MSGAARLYTPELLALAVRLADYPWSDGFPCQGEARSASCGSSLKLGLACDAAGLIARLGIRAQACAVGQAAAAIFAAGAPGLGRGEIERAAQSLRDWLSGDGPAPSWPNIALIEPARAYPGRHGAIMLPWIAALQALPKEGG